MPNKVEAAIKDLSQGKMIILTDDKDRENEGDIVVAAEKITPEIITFMAKEASGLICLSISQAIAQKLELNLMVKDNQESMRTAFTVSIDAKCGITTGISSGDRTKTILEVMKDDATADNLVRPGHIFPIIAKEKGLLERRGHTEASVELAKLAGLKPAAVICEIIGEDGTMLRDRKLANFAKKNQLSMISIAELASYMGITNV